MDRSNECRVDVADVAPGALVVSARRCGATPNWQDVDRGLREVARCRGALDGEEARLLCSALRLELWRELGHVTLLEYLEAVLGYSPRAAGPLCQRCCRFK